MSLLVYVPDRNGEPRAIELEPDSTVPDLYEAVKVEFIQTNFKLSFAGRELDEKEERILSALNSPKSYHN